MKKNKKQKNKKGKKIKKSAKIQKKERELGKKIVNFFQEDKIATEDLRKQGDEEDKS